LNLLSNQRTSVILPRKVFISYSHDSSAHETAVLALANRLRGDGIDAVLDQYESFPVRGWINWMKHQIRDTQFILVVCTVMYSRRADPGVADILDSLAWVYCGQDRDPEAAPLFRRAIAIRQKAARTRTSRYL
jgi:SEFIR domain/Tetratricopeptide repeat